MAAIELLNKYKTLFNKSGINTPIRLAHFFAQADNKVKYKDPNGERSGVAYVRENGDFFLIDQYIDFTISDSKKYPGQKEFIIKYNNEKIYYSGIMTGVKQ